MSLNDDTGNGAGSMNSLELDVDQFKLVFQVMKELSNLSDTELARVGIVRVEADALHEVLARIRGNIEGVVLIKIRVEGEGSLGEVDLIGSSVNSLGPLLRRDMLAKWREILTCVLAYIGGEELYHRTGYDEREIRAVINKLRLT